MSNYYLNSTTTTLKTVATKITDTTVAGAFVGHGLSTAAHTPDFTSSIDEKPTTTNYKYQGTDISTYLIAPYVESSGTTYSSIPSWCKNIRAVLIGGGGGGSNDIQQYNLNQVLNQQNGNHDHHVANQQGLVDKQHHHSFNQQDRNKIAALNQPANQQNQHVGGGGGGGGGFIYLNTTQVSPNQFQLSLGTGGTWNTNGASTTLTIGSTTYTAAGGNAGSQTSGGSGGSATGASIAVAGSNGSTTSTTSGGNAGKSGMSSTYSTISTIQNYGCGGSGATVGANSQGGTTGYYRIYFLQ